MMVSKLFLLIALLVGSSSALHGPCFFKNVTLMGGFSQKPIATPSNCGMATVNASELATKPNVILHSVNELREKNESYTFMLLEEIPQVRDVFRLRWLVSNITPLRRSLTANETSTQFAKYERPIADPNRSLKYFLYVYRQNKANGVGLVGLAAREIEEFAPQQWVTRNSRIIQDIVGGVEFHIAPNRSQTGYPNTHGGPVGGVPSQVPVPSHYPSPSYPSSQYPGQPQPGYTPPQPHYPAPPQPGVYPQLPQPHPPSNQTTVINNYYGKTKEEKDKKKKNSAIASLPIAGLIFSMAVVTVFRA